MIRLLAVCLAVIALLNIAFSQTSEKRVALVIGNKNYIHGGALTKTIEDAKTMKIVLEELNFKVIYLLDGTKTQMTSSFLDFIRKVNNADVSLIYYSGHGMQIDGVNHLIPVDANITDKFSARGFTININDWVSQLEANEQNLNIVILDACRNNPYKAFTKGTEKGLKQIPAPSGTIISFATLPDNVAQDNGLFAKTLATELRKNQRIIDVFMNTRNIIEAETNNQQSPMEWVRYNRPFNLVAKGNDIEVQEIKIPDSESLMRNFTNSRLIDKGYFRDPRDDQEYKVVEIGNQIWMAENLRSIRLNDGTAIPHIKSKTKWKEHKTPGYCFYDNKLSYRNTYGALYNKYAVKTGKLCPIGWHVPSHNEWEKLITELGGEENGGELKESGNLHWIHPNNGTTNETGFKALPGGQCDGEGDFKWIGQHGLWWTTTEDDNQYIWKFELNYNSTSSDFQKTSRNVGVSIRCVKD